MTWTCLDSCANLGVNFYSCQTEFLFAPSAVCIKPSENMITDMAIAENRTNPNNKRLLPNWVVWTDKIWIPRLNLKLCPAARSDSRWWDNVVTDSSRSHSFTCLLLFWKNLVALTAAGQMSSVISFEYGLKFAESSFWTSITETKVGSEITCCSNFSSNCCGSSSPQLCVWSHSAWEPIDDGMWTSRRGILILAGGLESLWRLFGCVC